MKRDDELKDVRRMRNDETNNWKPKGRCNDN